jgi:putative SOS response-associated peptidase YedK
MCGRSTLRTPLSVLTDEFQLDVSPTQQQLLLEPRYNIPPTLDIPVIRNCRRR